MKNLLKPAARQWGRALVMLPVLSAMNAAQARERQRILFELSNVKGIMPLLMKHRNGGHWTPEERATIIGNLHVLAGLSPYLVPIVMPGGLLLLPVLAWWLDRRRILRAEASGLTVQGHQTCSGDQPTKEIDDSLQKVEDKK